MAIFKECGISPRRRFYQVAKHPDADLRTPPRGTSGRLKRYRRRRKNASPRKRAHSLSGAGLLK
jgi:hypothetical protein